MVCVYTVVFNYPSVDGHQSRFHLLAIVSNAAMNMEGQISPQAPAFSSFGYIPGSGLAGSHRNSASIF